MNYAGILAGGIGSRMESKIPKQFLKIGDKPIIVRTLTTFLNNKSTDKIVLAMNPHWMDYCKNMLKEYKIDTNKIIITTGGTSRFLSMVNLVNAAVESSKAPITADDKMMIHDCARPFVSQRIIDDNFRIVDDYDMVTTSVPTIDTVIVSQDRKRETSVPDRDTIFLDQGPQTFRIAEFLNYYHQMTQHEISTCIEAGRMYMARKLNVGIVEGERTNFKITTEFDMLLADLMIKENKIK